ncbi:TonB-dependent receptor [Azospirillum sp. B4]|uniref:TonB-dependent receptor n=1 Tax=Azospirillum sp. B4 TaxID=95605 RepID=UPI000346957A|nr:TonB-dependent receptor [Azospirillum sp. B4]
MSRQFNPGKAKTGAALTAAALLLSMTAAQALAQTAPADAGALEEIIVTATRRSERLDQVPIAVSVLSGEVAERRLLTDIQDISTAVPALNFRTGASNKDRNIFVRGIGTVTTSPGVEPSVSTVVDGVVLARPGQATLDLLDIDHVEVLRGPQGTLFGKNATAGVINIVSKDPTEEAHGYVDAAYLGGGDEYRVKAGVSGALVPGKLTGLISAMTSGYDGNVTNRATGDTVNGYTHSGARAKLRFTPNDDVTVTVAADYLFSRDSVPTGVFITTTQTAYPTNAVTNSAALATSLATAGIHPSAYNTEISANTNSGTKDNNGGIAATVDWNLNGYTLTSVTAYRKWQNQQFQDYDQLSALSTGLPAVVDNGYLLFSQTSEELRLASPKGGLIDYVTGLYYMHAVDTEVYQRGVTQVSGGGTLSNNGTSRFGTTGDNYAAFGEATINITPDFRGIAGVRVVHDDLDYHFQRVSSSATAVTGIQPSYASNGSTGTTDYADRLGLQWDVDRDVSTYFTYSRGYMGPAYNVFFNMTSTAALALKPETSDSYEVGVKAKLLGGRLQANLAGYITNFDNYQANFTDTVAGAIVTRLINAGQVSTKGVEADFTYRPIDNLTLTQSLAWTQARVDHFQCPVGAASSCDIDGQPLPFAPDWKLDSAASYTVPLYQGLSLILDTDYRWQSKVQYQLTETPDTIQGAYGIWNGGVTLANTDQQWRASILVKNILDTHYSSYLARGNLAGVVRWVPRDGSRYWGVTLHKDF